MTVEDDLFRAAREIAASREKFIYGKEVGRYASRVRIKSPQGSWFDGRIGRVVRVEGDTVFVRFDRQYALPFGRGELEVIS